MGLGAVDKVYTSQTFSFALLTKASNRVSRTQHTVYKGWSTHTSQVSLDTYDCSKGDENLIHGPVARVVCIRNTSYWYTIQPAVFSCVTIHVKLDKFRVFSGVVRYI